MEYIEDIILNFQNNYYEFYEWKNKDISCHMKKIKVYKISSKDYYDIKYNNVIINLKNTKINSQTFLITNGIESMGLIIDKKGRVIKKSSLLLDEQDDVISKTRKNQIIKIHFTKNIAKPHQIASRNQIEKQEYLNKILKKINIKNNEYFLKYIYYEIYKKEEENINKIYQSLIRLIKENPNKLFNSIQELNLEIKK